MANKLNFPLINAALPWLLLSQLAALCLHISYMPISLWALIICFVAWRGLIVLGRLSHPNRWLKLLVVVLTLAVLALHIRGFNLESAGVFLISTSLLKVIELRTLRDGYILVFLNFFVLATGFLFNQSMLTALWGMQVVALLLIALLRMHYSPNSRVANKELFSQVAKLMLWSLPMMLVLYFLFPRLGPLWSFSLQSEQAKTGLSSNMAAGDIAELSQSSELAFRASFTRGLPPSRQELYWRALVLDNFDGKHWSASGISDSRFGSFEQSVAWYSDHEPATGVEYEVIQEPTGKNWLFALDYPQAIEPRTGVTADYRLVAQRPVFQRLRYKVRLVKPPYAGLTAQEQRRYLQLPNTGNALAKAWGAELAELPAEQAAQAIMRNFSTQAFYYTLKPQRYGNNEVDEFLFERKQGFCAHYASAMAFVARAAGIPARVVTGYQGGEWNELENYLTVRQYDAHAWVELWLEGQGWQRFDPTAMVAAERILYGLEEAVASEGTFLQGQMNAHRFKAVAWLNSLRIWADTLEYGWQKWVLSFDSERQFDFFQNVLKFKDYRQGLYWLAGGLVGVFLLVGMAFWWRSRPKPQPPLLRAWQALLAHEKIQPLNAQQGEALSMVLLRLAERYPALKENCLRIITTADALLYQAEKSEENNQQLIKEINLLRKRLS